MNTETKDLPCPRITRGQEKLTPEQEDYARQFAQVRIASMLSTTSIDEKQAEEHLKKAYTVAGIDSSSLTIRWFDSPISFILASVWDSVQASVQASVRDSVQASVQASVRDSVWDSVGDSVGASVQASVWDSVQASVWDSVQAYFDENWLAFYQFFHEIFEKNDLIHLALFNEMISGYRLGSKEAWLVRKPVRMARDEEGRLHSESGMCMQYRDGWGFYAWHGVRCSEKIILHADQLTRDDWLNEQNLEIRRVIQERLGERFVPLVGGECLNTGRYGKLIQIDLGDDPEYVAKYVHVQDTSTERQYYLRVPPTIERADEGVAWTFGMTEAEYCPASQA